MSVPLALLFPVNEEDRMSRDVWPHALPGGVRYDANFGSEPEDRGITGAEGTCWEAGSSQSFLAMALATQYAMLNTRGRSPTPRAWKG